MLCFRLFVKVFFIFFTILFNIIDLDNYTQFKKFEFNCMQFDNSNNANNFYNNVKSNDLSNNKTTITNIELDSNNNNDIEKDNNSQKKTSTKIKLNNNNNSDNKESKNRRNKNEQESIKEKNYIITNDKSYFFSIDLLVINYSKISLIVSSNINTFIKNNLSFVNLIYIYLVASTIIKMYFASIKTNF